MPFAYWCILAAALLPLVSFTITASIGKLDNHYPRRSETQLEGLPLRAHGAHLNALENFPFFAVAVIVAATQGATPSTLNMLAATYVAARILHMAFYLADMATLRSLSYVAGQIIAVAIFVLPAFK